MQFRFGRCPASITLFLLSLLLVASLPAAVSAADLTWSGFLGGAGFDEADAACFDDEGLPVVAGMTRSGDFPGTAAEVSVPDTASGDAYVARFSADGASLLWCRVFGGGDTDAALAVRPSGSGGLIVAGITYSADFPVTPGAFDTEYGGHGDLFVAELDARTGAIRWSGLLGGEGAELMSPSLHVEESGRIVVAGSTGSRDFPVNVGSVGGGGTDVFAAKLAADGSRLLWSTRFGGGASDLCLALAPSMSGDLLLAGTTRSPDFPVTPGAWDTTLGGGGDAFVARLSREGGLLWCSFLGGDDSNARESVAAIAGDRRGGVVVAGATSSPDFPATPWIHGHTPAGDLDAFCAGLSSDGDRLLWSRLIGGGGDDRALSLSLDRLGRPLLAGSTGSRDFPTTPDAIAGTHAGGETDAFLIRIDPAGGAPLWSSYLGGGGDDHGFALAAGRPGVHLLVGLTDTEPSTPFPSTPGVYDATANGRGDAFLCKVILPSLDTRPRPELQEPVAVMPPVRPGPRPEIRFVLQRAGVASLALFDPSGRKVRVFRGAPIEAGERTVAWDGRDDAGRRLPSGVYLARLSVGGESSSRKVLLLN